MVATLLSRSIHDVHLQKKIKSIIFIPEEIKRKGSVVVASLKNIFPLHLEYCTYP